MSVSSPMPASTRVVGREGFAKVVLLFTWFLLVITAFWMLKPVRVASLLSRLGAAETPYVKIASMLTVAGVVALYSRVVDRVSRLRLALGVSLIFSGLFAFVWAAMSLGGEALRASRAFVWAFYVLTDVYSCVMVAVFWTYANDVVTPAEADRLYGPIGLGGILGGVSGGALADALARPLGPTNLLLFCAAISALGGGVVVLAERVLRPPPRRVHAEVRPALSAALDGAREVARSPYLLLLVGILIAYEIASTMNDFAINVVFEHAFHGRTEMTRMYGRLGWVINGTALVAQLVLVPLVLPRKRVALLLVPAAMTVAAVGFVALPLVTTVFALAAADNGLSYSVQQSTKETLYVPLSDVQKYKSKAFIDMFALRFAKALAALAIIVMAALSGKTSARLPMLVSLAALAAWIALASVLARLYEHRKGEHPERPSAPQRPHGSVPVRQRPSLA